jgi:endonuclease YncB( thermonuclease family)
MIKLITPRFLAISLAAASLMTFLSPLTSQAAQTGTILSCLTGDTCYVLDDGIRYPIKVQGADAPAPGQPLFHEVKQFTASLLTGKQATFKCGGLKIGGTRQCDITTQNGKNVATLLIEKGYAWEDATASDGRYSELLKKAQASKVGIWATDSSKWVSPYCWKNTRKKECNDPKYQP